jgi:hypothetical protein
MSCIKPKKGICIDCGPESQETYLTAQRCKNHYWKHRAAVKAAANKQSDKYPDKQAEKNALDKWFRRAIEQMPSRCEECDDLLINFAPWALKSFVAHVLPKGKCKSVATHPDNKVYLCLICHTNFDNWGEEKVQKMKIFPKILDIQLLLVKHLKHNELDSIPAYVKILIYNA